MFTAGTRTSEFKLTIANFVVQVLLAWQGQITGPEAVKYSVAGAVAYILSRGLAKYEYGRVGPPPPPAG
jgi:hypothetical protein